MHNCDHPLSIVRPSLTFHIFDFSAFVERNLTKLDMKQDLNVLYKFRGVFVGPISKTNGRPASNFLIHFRLLILICWTELNETWQDARSPCTPPSVCFRPIGKPRWQPSLWLAEAFTIYPLNGIQWNLTWSKISTTSTKYVFRTDMKTKMVSPASEWLVHFWSFEICWNEFNETWQDVRSPCPPPSVCFGSIGKPKWSPQPRIRRYNFDVSFETVERNLTKRNRKQDIDVFYYLFGVLGPIRKNKMVA